MVRAFQNEVAHGNEMKTCKNGVPAHAPIALTKEEITDSALRRLLFEAGDDIENCYRSAKPISLQKPRKGKALFSEV